jgi:hypothetical protein
MHAGKGGAARKRPRGYARSDTDRRLIYHPQPRAVDLLPSDLGSHNTIWKAR